MINDGNDKKILLDSEAAIGIGTIIIFISTILVAGIAASIMIQTMGELENKAAETGSETLRDISMGLKVTQISGYYNGSTISQLAFFISPLQGSQNVNLSTAILSISDTSEQVILTCSDSIYSGSVSSGIFGTIDDTSLTASTFGVMVVRDYDSSCSSSQLTINEDDLVVLMVNASKSFSGIPTRTEIKGKLVPEYGIAGSFSFTTPTAYIDTIIDL